MAHDKAAKSVLLGFDNWRDRLDSIEKNCRKPGWDSYGADATTTTALQAAKILCSSLDVVPTNDGGLQISMAAEALAFEIGPDGVVNNVYADISEAGKYVFLKSREL